jgi:hypothetical protein
VFVFGILHDQSTNIVHVLCVSRWRILMGDDADEHAALQYLCSGVMGILAHMQLRNWVW